VENKGSDRMNLQTLLRETTTTQWEVFTQHSRRIDVQLRHAQREAVIDNENTGYGIRIITPRTDGAGVGFASCNSEKELKSTAMRAYDLAKVNRSPFFELANQQKLPPVETVDTKIVRDPMNAVVDYAEEAQALLADEKDISLTFGKIRTYVVRNQIVNSSGLSHQSVSTYVYLEMTFKIGTGSNPTEFWPTRYARRINDVAAEKTIGQWLAIARSSLKRHPPKTKETTVIFTPPIVCDTFLPTIGFHASAEAVKQGLSKFAPNARVGSEQLTIIDDGLFPFGLRSSPFDDEGQPQRRTKVIEKGAFKNHLYDQQHAQTMKAKPTGNGIRSRGLSMDVDERFSVAPNVATTNMVIKPGDRTLESLIKEVKEGLIIHQAAWLNPDEITTRFGSEIRNAQEIVNGELGEGVVGGTVSGTMLDLVKNITGISNKSEIVSGYAFGCVAPYIRFDRVQISGPA
jgi:predicted Zn-dependent protease